MLSVAPLDVGGTGLEFYGASVGAALACIACVAFWTLDVASVVPGGTVPDVHVAGDEVGITDGVASGWEGLGVRERAFEGYAGAVGTAWTLRALRTLDALLARCTVLAVLTWCTVLAWITFVTLVSLVAFLTLAGVGGVDEGGDGGLEAWVKFGEGDGVVCESTLTD